MDVGNIIHSKNICCCLRQKTNLKITPHFNGYPGIIGYADSDYDIVNNK